MEHETMEFKDRTLRLIDQRKLPSKIKYFEATDFRDVIFAISEMVVRGAPAIGATGAFGVYLAALEYSNKPKEQFIRQVGEATEKLAGARPTAVNLAWALQRMEELIKRHREKTVEKIVELIHEEAEKITEEDVKTNKKMASKGVQVVPERGVILTHCNTGALATVGYGTALGVVREAHKTGKGVEVYVDETRPRLQGARLTAFELMEEGIPATLIVDSAAATLIRDGEIDIVLVGADRIAANGDTANKIGTYNLSELASRHGVPFYVVAPTSTIDLDIETGERIEIEERPAEEVRNIQDSPVAPESIDVYNPAFDVSPAENITGIITEEGIVRPPFEESLKDL